MIGVIRDMDNGLVRIRFMESGKFYNLVYYFLIFLVVHDYLSRLPLEVDQCGLGLIVSLEVMIDMKILFLGIGFTGITGLGVVELCSTIVGINKLLYWDSKH